MHAKGGSGTPWGRFAAVWLLLSGLLLAAALPNLAGWRFPDPDDSLRLIQVRDLLAGQGWFDLHQYRIDPGASPVMHWSRIVDVPLALVIGVLTPLTGQTLAEQAAVILLPLLTLGATMAVIGRLAFRLFGREAAVLACLACAFSPALLFQLQPMRIDHHGWQVFAVAVALGALIHHRPWIGGSVAGAALAAGLSISLEILPLAAAFSGVLLVRWLRDPAQRGWLAGYLGSLAGGLAALFALTRGFGDLTQYCDVISPAHVGFFAVVGAGTAGICAKRNLPPAGVVALLGTVGAAALALYLSLAPQCLAGPFADLDPLVRTYWYVNVGEGMPFWTHPLDRSLPVVAQGLLALGVTFHLWRRAEGELRNWWFDYALLLGAALVGGMLVWRSMAFVGAIAAVPLGWLAHRLLERFRGAPRLAARLGVVAMAIAAFVPASPVALAKRAVPDVGGARLSKVSESSCDLRANLPMLGRLAPATVFAPIDIGPAVLERTRHSVVATGHHRGRQGMRDVILAFTSGEAAARAIVRSHGARYVLVCTDLVEPQLYAKDAPRGLMAQLLDGKPPAWLEEVPLPASRTFRLWRVRN